jgi:sugar/nucleoside kinase (ribokinase family)
VYERFGDIPYRIVYEGFGDISHLVQVAANIGRCTSRGKGAGERSAASRYGKLGDSNANEEVLGTAEGIIGRSSWRCLGRNKRIICLDIKEVARERKAKAIRVVGSAPARWGRTLY